MLVALRFDQMDVLRAALLPGSLPLLLGLYLMAAAIGRTLYVMAVIRPARLTACLVGEFRRWLTWDRLANALPVILVIPVLMGNFTFLKVMIPAIEPFYLDPLLRDIDWLLHAGQEPWRWLQPVIGKPLVTSAINAFYHSWLFLMFGVLFWQVFALEHPRLRMRFLLTFALSWILIGNLAATLLSSAGPVYFGRLFPDEPNPFPPLLNYLHQANEYVPVWALHVQEMLWASYANQEGGLGRGISAMPSMHIASSVLMALVGWQRRREFGIALTVFTGAIFLGSVHLGWHYAVDAYVAAVLVTGLWWFSGRIPGGANVR